MEAWGSGHIHETYRVRCQSGSYLLQRINRDVFPHPRLVMENIERVTSHTRQRLLAEGLDEESIRRRTLRLVPGSNGRTWLRSPEGEWWRMYDFISGSTSLEKATSADNLFQAGQVIGRFQSVLSDLPEPPLHAVIPHFHNTPRRLRALRQALRRNAAGRAEEAGRELALAGEFADQAGTLAHLLEQGRLPWRVTHNDTKLSNVLFDEASGAGLCLVDLDTVMPGSALYDLGDAARGGVNSAAEDEPDPGKVGVDREKYAALLDGYLSSAKHFLSALELELLDLAAWTMAFEQGVRFLTDHLNGDQYYKVAYPGHNRVRARAQFALAKAFLNS